jgi:hypothetical protein
MMCVFLHGQWTNQQSDSYNVALSYVVITPLVFLTLTGQLFLLFFIIVGRQVHAARLSL